MSAITVGDWMKLHTGDHVTEINGRHVGRGEAITISRPTRA
jgi:hypothetical protein